MSFVLRRIGVSLFLVWVVASLVFLSIHLVPGDPAEMLLSQGGQAPDPVQVAELREQLGLDQPIGVQYARSMTAMLQGDLGRSIQDDTPVADSIVRRLPRTLELIGAGAVLAIIVGLPAGVWAAVRRGGWFDRGLGAMTGVALSVPVFVTGTLLVLVFAQWLHWVPAGGYVGFAQDPGQHLVLLAMPAFTIALGLAAIIVRMARAAVLEVFSRDYVRTARAKGVAPGRVLVHHVVRNAIGPVVTVVALHMGSLLGGTVLVEYVFNWPGLSGLLVDAVSARDYPSVVGIILVISVLFVALNLLVDLLYGVIDPRVRAG